MNQGLSTRAAPPMAGPLAVMTARLRSDPRGSNCYGSTDRQLPPQFSVAALRRAVREEKVIPMLIAGWTL
jgi:hypothetical protein